MPQAPRGGPGALLGAVPWPPSPAEVRKHLGEGMVGDARPPRSYQGRGDSRWFEAARPGAGWHRHDWRPLKVLAVVPTPAGAGVPVRVVQIVIHRRRWLKYGTTETRQDHAPDELDGVHAVVLVVLLRLWSWLSATRGLEHYDEVVPGLQLRSRRTVQRWLHRLLPAADRLQVVLRTTLIERIEPQPLEGLFPTGLSPPERIRCRWWKDLKATYSLATGLAFLFGGAVALKISATVLLAEARTRLDGKLGTTGF